MHTIFQDTHELTHSGIIKLHLQKQSLNVVIHNNEPDGLADYWWNSGVLEMWERKKSGELLSCLGGKLDTQLIKYNKAHPDAKIGILQEGLITPTMDDKCQLWNIRVNKKTTSLIRGKVSPMSYSAYRAYMYRRQEEGFGICITIDEYDTAATLSTMLHNSMKAGHKGLNGLVVAKKTVVVKVDDDRLRNYKIVLMTNRGIGEAAATRLLNAYDTPWSVYSIPYDMLVGTESKRIADIIFSGIGKETDAKA